MGNVIKMKLCEQCGQSVHTAKAGKRHMCKPCVGDYMEVSNKTFYHPDDILLEADYTIPREKRIVHVMVKNDAERMAMQLPENWGTNE